MKVLVFILFSVVFCFIWNFIYLCFGFSLYFLSNLIHSSNLEQFSVKIIAYADAAFFGAHRHWIAQHCSSSDCANCRLWTCAGKEVK